VSRVAKPRIPFGVLKPGRHPLWHTPLRVAKPRIPFGVLKRQRPTAAPGTQTCVAKPRIPFGVLKRRTGDKDDCSDERR